MGCDTPLTICKSKLIGKTILRITFLYPNEVEVGFGAVEEKTPSMTPFLMFKKNAVKCSIFPSIFFSIII